MKYGSGSAGASVSYVGSDEHIDEFVLFANSKDARICRRAGVSDDMNPNNILTLMSVLKI
jgi:hypothetical protein